MGSESGAARMAAAAIALIGWVGLAVQFSATFEQSGSLAVTVWILLRYFTILTNLLVAIVFTGIALGKPAFRSPALLGGITLAILLVGVTYNLVLRGLIELHGAAKLANFILHDMVPVLVPLFWLLFAPKGGLRIRDGLLWSLYPGAYLAYALTRGEIENKYAYPFMDVAKIGWLQTATNAFVILLGFLAAILALVWLDRRLTKK
ncbi:hypothetical protein G3545_05935 [Starkeya sp. ORNL1]|uniref:Pr6Pr family membrane protein n=1 Tax=Starkeya sp. ORNL1 TaxID=2709380 RepID=UPI001464081C|nr:Pr6Pr family membrane protein [Starkeya sp. ORNL1]QJP13228.1 hypothetical protein G3545_05935 [Starkeya sp. ORNL1]